MTEIWEKLSGKRIAVVGPESKQKKEFQENLAHISTRMGGSFRVTELLENAEEQYIILFAEAQDHAGEQELRGQLLRLTEIRPTSVVLVSGHTVYGKLYGTPRLLKEQELGYVCHTKAEDMRAAGLRVAEHLAYRLAREEHLQITVARVGDTEKSEIRETQIEQILTILLQGAAGEIYNIAGEQTPLQESPLSAVKVTVDASKTGALCY